MTVEISSAVLRAILDESAAFPGREVCGLLFGTPDRITGAQSCRNVDSDPARSFEIDPAQLIAAHRAARDGGPQIIGSYHSHPVGAPVPSARDAASAMPDRSIWLIVGGGKAGLWRAVEGGIREGLFDPVEYRLI